LSGSSSAVERQLPKLDVAGSIPVSRSNSFGTPQSGSVSEWYVSLDHTLWGQFLCVLVIFLPPVESALPDNGDMRNHLVPRVSLLFVVVVVAIPLTAQKFEYNKQAELDGKGNIFVSSNDGKLIWMADTRHCSEATFANDRQTVGCMVAPSSNSFPPAPTCNWKSI
jgi:hypothetical protein